LPNGNKDNFRRLLKIAGLAIEIRSPWDLAMMNAEPFRQPRAAGSGADIIVHFHTIGADDQDGPPIDPERDPRLAKAGRRGSASPLLRSRAVAARLDETLGHGERLFAEILPEALSILDFQDQRADFFFASGSAPGPEQRVAGPALLAPFLPAFDACLLHASAIARRGRVVVFLAPDEGGKTTAARLSLSGTILGDDQVIVRRSGGGFRVYGTPWGLDVDATSQAPLAGLFLLEKADRFALSPCPARELVPFMWREVMDPISILPKPSKKKAFAVLCAIAAAAPAWRLSFPRDYIDWEAIDQATTAAGGK
jgi:hypothetical protein